MKREAREEILARLLTRSLELLGQSVPQLPDTEEGRALAGAVAEFEDDCREFMANLMQTTWAPGEAPPGVDRLQVEVRERDAELAAEERRVARNKRKSPAGKAANRRRN